MIAADTKFKQQLGVWMEQFHNLMEHNVEQLGQEKDVSRKL